MEKEFKLSEKMFGCIPPGDIKPIGRICIKVEDVKEFIRLLKENKIVLDIDKSEDYKEGFCDGVLFMMSKIDKLAGDFN